MKKSKVEIIAERCHEVNRAYCESVGDNSQPTWEDAPEWQRKSAMAGVVFHQLNPNARPEDSHNSWMREKIADGWVYGETKDPKKKEHPCMVNYEELPEEQQMKDKLFILVVKSFN